jgi:hypothetical protein
MVEPCPSKSVLSSSQLLGNIEVILVRVVGISVVSKISRCVLRRATSLNRLDDLPD